MSSSEFCSTDCTVSNLGTPSFDKLSKTGLIDWILGGTLFEELLSKLRNGGVSDQGTVQIYAGYSTLNQKLDKIHSVTAPQIIATTNTRYVKKMVDCTALIQVFGTVHPLLPLPWNDDPARMRDWAQRLCTVFHAPGVNQIEQMTFALTCVDHEGLDQPLILGSHFDHLNDLQWPEVFCIY